jgi:hypothetical protein
MLRRVIYAGFLAGVSCGVAAADDFIAMITRVDGSKVSFRRVVVKLGEKWGNYGDEETLVAAEDVKVHKGRRDRQTKKIEAGDDIPDGLKDDPLKGLAPPRTLGARLITDDSDKKISKIIVILPVGGKKP